MQQQLTKRKSGKLTGYEDNLYTTNQDNGHYNPDDGDEQYGNIDLNDEQNDDYDDDDGFIDDTPIHPNPYMQNMLDNDARSFLNKIKKKRLGRQDDNDSDIEEATHGEMDDEEAQSRRIGIREDQLEELNDQKRKKARKNRQGAVN